MISAGDAGAARALAALFARAGLPCELDVGPVGLVVYAAKKSTVEAVARQLLKNAQTKDPKARTTPAEFDKDEQPETAWWTTVEFDWRRF